MNKKKFIVPRIAVKRLDGENLLAYSRTNSGNNGSKASEPNSTEFILNGTKLW